MSRRDTDLRRLGAIADELEPLDARRDELIEHRRIIFARRVAKGDTTKVELGKAARTSRLNVTAALKPHLVAAAPKRRRAAAKRGAAA